MSDTFVTLWTVGHQALLSVGFPRQEYWSRLSFPSPEDLPHPGTEPTSPAWPVDSLPLSHLGISKCKIEKCYFLFSYENTEIHHFLKSGSKWLGLVISIKPKTYWCQYLQFKNTGVGLPFLSPGNLPDPVMELTCPALQVDFFCWAPGKPEIYQLYYLLRNSFLLSWLSVLFSMLLISALIIFFSLYCLIQIQTYC